MKNIMLLLGLTFSFFTSNAQSFFYIENNNPTEKSIREELIKASQYITQSPLASDYIIRADAGIQDGYRVLNLKMTVQDSISLKTIFQANEDYTISVVNANTRIFLRMVISAFIDKNVNQIITCAREDHQNAQMKFLKARKDKT